MTMPFQPSSEPVLWPGQTQGRLSLQQQTEAEGLGSEDTNPGDCQPRETGQWEAEPCDLGRVI